jgi:hypothetical protein
LEEAKLVREVAMLEKQAAKVQLEVKDDVQSDFSLMELQNKEAEEEIKKSHLQLHELILRGLFAIERIFVDDYRLRAKHFSFRKRGASSIGCTQSKDSSDNGGIGYSRLAGEKRHSFIEDNGR